LQLDRSIQYNDKSNSNTSQQSVTEITNAFKILYIFIKLTSNKIDNSRTTRFTGNDYMKLVKNNTRKGGN